MNEPTQSKPGWRIARRIFIVLAILATLIAAFYTEEDWRGKRAWENCKRESEAQGVVLDWNRFSPPSVPDDQNFFTANSNILLRFKLHDTNDPDYKAAVANPWLQLQISDSNTFPMLDTSKSGPLVVATIIISPSISSKEHPLTKTVVLALNDPAATGQAQDLIRATVGKSIEGAQGFLFSERQLTAIQPAQIFVRVQTPPSISDLESLIPSDSITNIGRLQITATANQNIFQVSLTDVRITAAADYLKWSDQYVPAFDEIREALKRPYAILPGDYSTPALMPIPNFVAMRLLAQTLAQRAQCDLLLGEPDKALQELTLIHDVCRILEKPPTGQPEMLVEAMINVAISGLYAEVIAEGFQRHAWREPQLIALQEQLAQIHLPVVVERASGTEPIGAIHTLETVPYPKLQAMITPNQPWWARIKFAGYYLLPRGWIYQNMTAIADLRTVWLGAYDSENQTVLPSFAEKYTKATKKMVNHLSPYNFMAIIALPNITRAWQKTAFNQTLVNQAQIACALERYRLAHGEYPDTLDALAPQFKESIPHDIIGGQPMHYHPTVDGKFSLYSVGWDGKDHGGRYSASENNGHGADIAKGNWVWGVINS